MPLRQIANAIHFFICMHKWFPQIWLNKQLLVRELLTPRRIEGWRVRIFKLSKWKKTCWILNIYVLDRILLENAPMHISLFTSFFAIFSPRPSVSWFSNLRVIAICCNQHDKWHMPLPAPIMDTWHCGIIKMCHCASADYNINSASTKVMLPPQIVILLSENNMQCSQWNHRRPIVHCHL